MNVYSSCVLGGTVTVYSSYVLGVQWLCILAVYWGTVTVYSGCVLGYSDYVF